MVEKDNTSQAAELFLLAAQTHPKKACASSYRMNGVGALVGKWNPATGWRWDPGKKENIGRALKEIETAQAELDEAKANDCKCAGSTFDGLQGWITTQRKWLERMQSE